MKKWWIALLAALVLIPCAAMAEGSAADVLGGYILFTDTLPETLIPVFSGAEWADDAPVTGAVFSRFDEWSYGQVVMRGDTGYTLCCLIWLRDQQQWQLTASSAAIPQDCAPEIVYKELSWGLSEEDRDQYNIGSSFRLVYPQSVSAVSEQSWFCGSDGWRLQGMTVNGEGVSMNARELIWNDESIYNMRDILLEGFVLADFPKTIGEARALAAADPVLNDATAGTTVTTENYGWYRDVSPAFPIWTDESRREQIGWGFAHTAVEVLEATSELTKVRIDSVVGWIPRECVKIGLERSTEYISQERGRVLAVESQTEIPMYATAGGATVSGYAQVDTVVGVTVMSKGGEWIQIRTGETSGWVKSDMIGLTDNYAHAYVINDVPENRLHLRAAPSKSAESLGKYYSGIELDLLWQEEPVDGWSRVSVAGVSGWMSSEYMYYGSVNSMTGYLPPLGTVNGPNGGVHLREGPGYEYAVRMTHPNGVKVEILGIADEWAHVRLKGGGVTGYMLLDYIGGEPARASSDTVTLLADANDPLDGTTIPAGTKVRIEERPREQWHYPNWMESDYSEQKFGLPETVWVYVPSYETGAYVPVTAVDCGW